MMKKPKFFLFQQVQGRGVCLDLLVSSWPCIPQELARQSAGSEIPALFQVLVAGGGWDLVLLLKYLLYHGAESWL